MPELRTPAGFTAKEGSFRSKHAEPGETPQSSPFCVTGSSRLATLVRLRVRPGGDPRRCSWAEHVANAIWRFAVCRVRIHVPVCDALALGRKRGSDVRFVRPLRTEVSKLRGTRWHTIVNSAWSRYDSRCRQTVFVSPQIGSS